MSSSNLLSIGTRALTANQAALETIGHNIANVNTPGYSRQTVVLRSSAGQLVGSGFYGKGVDVATVERVHSEFLTRQVVQTRAISAADQVRADRLEQVEPIFATGDNGLGAAIDSVLNGFADVALSPRDTSARQVVLARADEMAARFNTAAQRLDALDADVGGELSLGVRRVNDLASQIAKLNQLIANQGGAAHAPNDLLDQREQSISDLSQYVQVSTVPASDGALNVFLGGGQALVLGSTRMPLRVAADPADPTRQTVAVDAPAGTVHLDDGALAGGEIAGLLAFQRNDLADARNQLGRLALATGMLMNAEQRLGLDASGNPGQDLFALPALPGAIAALGNAGNAQVGMAVTDPTALQSTDYELTFSAGQVDVLRRSDGVVRSFSSLPADVDGLRITLAGGSAQPGDRFVLQPLSRAAGGMTLKLSAASQLAVAEPVAAAPAAANQGSLKIQSLHAQSADANLLAPVTLTFHANGTFDASGAGTGGVTGQPWASGDALSFNGWTLQLAGVPAEGDTFTIGPAPVPVRDAQRAQGFLSLRDRPAIDGATLTHGYAAILGDIGTRVQSARYASEVSTSMADQAQSSRTALSGVNLDEEAARLLQYQQAYQASARILQVAQSVFDTLLQSMR